MARPSHALKIDADEQNTTRQEDEAIMKSVMEYSGKLSWKQVQVKLQAEHDVSPERLRQAIDRSGSTIEKIDEIRRAIPEVGAGRKSLEIFTPTGGQPHPGRR